MHPFLSMLISVLHQTSMTYQPCPVPAIVFPIPIPFPPFTVLCVYQLPDMSGHILHQPFCPQNFTFTWFPGPTPVHIPNGMSIGSAAFTRLMAERRVHILHNWLRLSPSKLSPRMGDMDTHLIHGSLVHPIHKPNSISIGSAVFVGLTTVRDQPTDRTTDRPHYCACNNRPHLCGIAKWPNNNKELKHISEDLCRVDRDTFSSTHMMFIQQ